METTDLLEKLQTAFHADDAAEARRLLNENPEAKEQINAAALAFDSPPILHAKSKAMLDALLEAGADINVKSKWWAGGFGFLHSAPRELALYGIERGAKVDIHAAARLGLKDELEALLKADPELVHRKGGDGQTPLHFASTLEIAKILVEAGADINAKDVDHESTPAQYMVRDRQEIARYLVEKGCKKDMMMAAALGLEEVVREITQVNPGAISTNVSGKYFPRSNPKSGGSIYIWALGNNKSVHAVAKEFGHESIYQFLMEQSKNPLKFAIACELKDAEIAKKILEIEPDIISKLTPDLLRKLPQAAEHNDADAVALMLEYGWPITPRARHNATALHWSGFHGNKRMAELLLPRTTNLEDAENEFKSTPLGWAIYGSENGWHCKTGDYAGTVKSMLAAGAKRPEKISGTPAVQEVLQGP